MPISLRVLIVSDCEEDALRLVDELRKSDYLASYECVKAADAFREALAQKWDLILADYAGGEIHAIAALEVLREAGADIPLVASADGPTPEESVLEALKAGAAGLIRRDHLSRLGATVARAMSQAEGRRERGRLEQQ